MRWDAGLGATGRTAETGHHFIENERGTGFFRNFPDFAHEFPGLQPGGTALHGFDHHGGEFVCVGLQDFQ